MLCRSKSLGGRGEDKDSQDAIMIKPSMSASGINVEADARNRELGNSEDRHEDTSAEPSQANPPQADLEGQEQTVAAV